MRGEQENCFDDAYADTAPMPDPTGEVVMPDPLEQAEKDMEAQEGFKRQPNPKNPDLSLL